MHTWPNGKLFIGTTFYQTKGLYEDDLKEGYGMFMWPNG